ncbi:hypothetical protein [Nocardioides plantarum]|uniref:hypothetical protein n=1 Tax=Nocardioides plantarum TaxID=29299 RepID=UPI00360A7945
MPPRPRRTTDPGLLLPGQVAAEIREGLPAVAEEVVAAIIDEVPSYTDAFNGPMGARIRGAVEVALGGFLSLASSRHGTDPRTPTAPAVDGAYQLGRGEARGGRSTEALLSAYRIGARVSWQRMAQGAVRAGLDAETLASFAALVFAYIDELSAASVAGHTDELATTGRVRQRRLERLAHHLVARSDVTEETVRAAVDRADWPEPRTLTAVVVPESQVRPLLAVVPPTTLQAADPRASTRGSCSWSPTSTAVPAPGCCAPYPSAVPSPAPPAPGCRCGRPTSGSCGPGRSAWATTPSST